MSPAEQEFNLVVFRAWREVGGVFGLEAHSLAEHLPPRPHGELVEPRGRASGGLGATPFTCRICLMFEYLIDAQEIFVFDFSLI